MIRVVEEPVNQIPRQPEPEPSVTDHFSLSEKRIIAQKMVQLIGMFVADHPKKVRKLLTKYRIKVPEHPTDKALVDRLIYQLSKEDQRFTVELSQLMYKHIPGIAELGGTDSFDAGAAVGNAIGQTAGGAAGGGWVGAAIGLVSGGLGLAKEAKAAKNEREKAENMTMASLLNYKSAKEQNSAMASSSRNKIIIAVVLIIGLIGGGVLLITLNKSNSAANTQTA